jgi:hypothetical protein
MVVGPLISRVWVYDSSTGGGSKITTSHLTEDRQVAFSPFLRCPIQSHVHYSKRLVATPRILRIKVAVPTLGLSVISAITINDNAQVRMPGVLSQLHLSCKARCTAAELGISAHQHSCVTSSWSTVRWESGHPFGIHCPVLDFLTFFVYIRVDLSFRFQSWQKLLHPYVLSGSSLLLQPHRSRYCCSHVQMKTPEVTNLLHLPRARRELGHVLCLSCQPQKIEVFPAILVQSPFCIKNVQFHVILKVLSSFKVKLFFSKKIWPLTLIFH